MSDKLNLISSYDYDLPQELIANYPLTDKKSAKLLVYDRANDKISHLHFYDLNDILPSCNIIFNDTKVIKARIFGHKDSGGKIELLINQSVSESKFSVYIRGNVRVGSILHFGNNLSAKVVEIYDDGLRVVEFFKDDRVLNSAEVYEILSLIGHVPLPPYIKREDIKEDEDWYQSIFAKFDGAVAAPTASLHFDEELLNSLKLNHKIFYITLHVGAGTFKPVEVQDINDHKMHSEIYNIPDDTAKIIDSNEPILGIGTTCTRCIEYYARYKKLNGSCDLFLHPNNKPIRQNYLLTNFHLPKSTLIMLVASFIGLEKTLEIYQIAIKNRYRFYSYGDGMLIL